MNRLASFVVVVVMCCSIMSGADYNGQKASFKAVVIKEVSRCLVDSDIAILYSRLDEYQRKDDVVPSRQIKFLNLGQYRKIATLKGGDRTAFNAKIYTYEPEIPEGGRLWLEYGMFRARLGGRAIGDNQFRVMFIKKSRGINKKAVKDGKYVEWHSQSDPDYMSNPEDFVADFDKMNEAAYLKKYGLFEMFRTSVYDIQSVVSFGFRCNIDVTLPNVTRGEFATNTQVSRERMEAIGDRMIQLTKRELSELVYIAYVCDDDSGGIEAYNEAQRKNPQFLVPLSEPVEFKTEFGRKIHQKITTGHVEEDAVFNRNWR